MRTYELPKRLAKQAMREAEQQIIAKHKLGVFDEGDPNHPKYNNGINYATGLPANLFGYDIAEFLNKQYK